VPARPNLIIRGNPDCSMRTAAVGCACGALSSPDPGPLVSERSRRARSPPDQGTEVKHDRPSLAAMSTQHRLVVVASRIASTSAFATAASPFYLALLLARHDVLINTGLFAWLGLLRA